MSITYFTSESVCAGHPDKVCDQISDAILDACLVQDPYSRVAVETMVKQKLILAGELTAQANLDLVDIARSELRRLGYTDRTVGLADDCEIEVHLSQQSTEIAFGVNDAGAGDQGMMFGYACNQTEQCMPLPIAIAHALAKRIDEVRENAALPYLRPDGKTQVTIAYENGVPIGVGTIVIAVPHDECIALAQLTTDLKQQVIGPILEDYNLPCTGNLVVNGTGVWHGGGPAADAGLTGRKIVVDGYGGYARVGGGAFSGKDPSKVDRSGAYAARYIAKNIVAHGLAKEVEVRLAYVIGQSQPLMQQLETFGSQTVSEAALHGFAGTLLDTSVGGIIEGLQLRQPIYRSTAAYGHFGRPQFPWEEVAAI